MTNRLPLKGKLFAGSSHPALASQVAKELGVSLGKRTIGRFPDGEIALEIQEDVRGENVFVLQTIARDPNNYLFELLMMIDAVKRASARTIIAVIPYFGYCRQDREDRIGVPITAKLVANLLVNTGVTHILTVDLHAGQLQGFFDIPVDNLFGQSFLAEAILKQVHKNFIVVAPDIGSVKLALTYAKYLNVDLAVINKERLNAEEVDAVTLIGDVKGKDVLLADDMCSTAGTLVSAAKACHEKGAQRIFAIVTHGLFVGEALNKIKHSPIEALLVSDTVPMENMVSKCTKIHSVSIAPSLSQAIRCIVSKDHSS